MPVGRSANKQIFDQALGKYPDKLPPGMCGYRDNSAQFAARIAHEIELREDNKPCSSNWSRLWVRPTDI